MTTNEAMGEHWPDVLTVEQAAVILRISRTTAYDHARTFLRTGGADGLPVIRVGRLMRVPRVQLEAMLGGPLQPPPLPSTRPASPRRTRKRRTRSNPPTLPFAS